ncbi:MAG: hypothetical protein JF593_07785 [Novosphingobium sp.]|nr:hypothetical protein [Novosphingobium sp.]
MEQQPVERYAVVVGWTSDDLGGRILLKFDSFEPGRPRDPEHLVRANLFMTKTQAVQLGDYLFKITGQRTPTPQPRGWLARFFSG